MISREIIQKILSDACTAPSGGNSQPWEFVVENNKIRIISKPEKDHPVLNVHYRGTWIAHGALIENICICASNYGISCKTKIFPEDNDKFLTCIMELEQSQTISKDKLFTAVLKRATNRKPFLTKPIATDIVNDLRNIIQATSGIKAEFISERGIIEKIANIISVGDRIMFENKILHKLFFKEVAWNKKHEKQRGGGLLLDTLELKPPQRIMLHLLQYWPVMQIAARLGLAKQIAKENAQTHSSCGLLCGIVVPQNKNYFIEVGRQIQRLWLMATNHGLSVQINTGLFFFWQGIKEGSAASIFSKSEQDKIKEAYNSITSLFKAENDIVTAVIRIGYDGEPSTRSIKLAPN